MRLLLDTHDLLWWLSDDPALPPRANAICVSAASAWEIATKSRLGKLAGAEELARDFEAFLVRESFEPFPISVGHAARAGLLPGPHKDPFDRMLIAQAQAENFPIISNDPVFDSYKLRRLWD